MFYDILKIGAFFGGASFVNLKKMRVFWVFSVVVVIFYLPRFLASTGVHIQVPNKRTNPNDKGKAVKYAFMTTFGRNLPR